MLALVSVIMMLSAACSTAQVKRSFLSAASLREELIQAVTTALTINGRRWDHDSRVMPRVWSGGRKKKSTVTDARRTANQPGALPPNQALAPTAARNR